MIRNERGSALLTTLLTFAVVMIFGTILLSRGNYSMRETKLDVDHERARYVAESTLNATIGELKSNQTRLVNVVNTIQSGGTMVGTKPTSGTVSVAADSDYKVTIQQGSTSDYLEIIAEGKHNAATYSKTAVLKINRNGGLFSNGAALASTRVDISATEANPLTIVGNLIVRNDSSTTETSGQSLKYINVIKNPTTNEGGNLYGYPNNKSLTLNHVTADNMEFNADNSTTGPLYILDESKATDLKIRAFSPSIKVQNSSFENMAVELNKGDVEISSTPRFKNLEVYVKNDAPDSIDILNLQAAVPFEGQPSNQINIHGPLKQIYINNCLNTKLVAGTAWAPWASSIAGTVESIDTSNASNDLERSLTLTCPTVDEIEQYMGCKSNITEAAAISQGFTEFTLDDFKDLGVDGTNIAYKEYYKEFPAVEPDGNDIVMHIIMSISPDRHYEVLSDTTMEDYKYGIMARKDMDPTKDHYFVFNEGLGDNKVILNLDYNTELTNCYIYVHSPEKSIGLRSLPKTLEGSLVFAKLNNEGFMNNGPVKIVYRSARDMVPYENPPDSPGSSSATSSMSFTIEGYK